MMISRNDTVIYVPTPIGIDADERWDIVAASLRSAGFTNIVAAPLPAPRWCHRETQRPQTRQRRRR